MDIEAVKIDEQVKSNSSAIVNIWDAAIVLARHLVSLDTNGPKVGQKIAGSVFSGRSEVGTHDTKAPEYLHELKHVVPAVPTW